MTVEEFTAKLDGLGQQLSDPQSILTEVGTEIVNAMKAGAPVDTGALKKSGKLLVNEKHVGENVPAIVVTYGNDKVDYAIYQHENLDYFHNIGQAKFIEQPAREYRLTLIHIVEREFK